MQGFVGGDLGSIESPFHIYGPGDRGQLPTAFPPGRPTPVAFNPDDPTPGTASMVRQMLAAFGTDINDRIFDAGSPNLAQVIQAHDIVLPQGATTNPTGPPPRMAPFTVYEDNRVHVTATLVDHGQIVPSYAFRFDSDHGSVVVSGDTTLTPNLYTLAEDCDVLSHEIIDYASVAASINALPVSAANKEAFSNHMFGAHTTETQMAELLGTIKVGTLVLHHLVPVDIGKGGWESVAKRLARVGRTDVVAGVDGMSVGAR